MCTVAAERPCLLRGGEALEERFEILPLCGVERVDDRAFLDVELSRCLGVALDTQMRQLRPHAPAIAGVLRPNDEAVSFEAINERRHIRFDTRIARGKLAERQRSSRLHQVVQHIELGQREPEGRQHGFELCLARIRRAEERRRQTLPTVAGSRLFLIVHL
jgi:hypothetical protein